MKNKLIKIIASCFGLGYSPLMPGTCGSLLGVAIYYLVHDQPKVYLWVLTIFIIVISVVVNHEAEKVFGQKDCQKIVIDEVAGQLVTYLFISYTLQNLLLGFVFFRFFDMTKIFPTNWIEKNVPGGLGVVADDLSAGIQAGILLYFLPDIIRLFSG